MSMSVGRVHLELAPLRALSKGGRLFRLPRIRSDHKGQSRLLACGKQASAESARSSRIGAEPLSGPAAESSAIPLKALVVDDEPDVLGAAIELFKAMGYDVISATNGLEAVELAKSHPALDVLFTDVLMPGLDGVSVALEVRKLNPELKVVLVSGFPASALTTAGATDFDLLLKPYSRSQVAKLLRK